MNTKGKLHILTQFNRNSIKYFIDRNFKIYFGNQIESEWSNFDSLNVPKIHPSRDEHDTFWVDKPKNHVLRTHATGSEINIIKKHNLKPPFNIIVPGRCFRNERTDNSHEHTFYQLDGIMVGKHINMKHLIGILSGYFKYLYGNNIKVKTVPSYFPFVEPGLEMHVKLPDGKWREMLGAGMGHPAVLKNMGIDPNKWQAAMWGQGIDRFAMIKYGINDIRNLRSQDLRFIKQF